MQNKANRILSITFENIKTINKGRIESPDIYNTSKIRLNPLFPSIVGIYGQNGTGKTTVIECLNLLKLIATNYGLTQKDERTNTFIPRIPYLISLSAPFAHIHYEFLIFVSSTPFIVNYSLGLRKVTNSTCTIREEKLSAKIFDKSQKGNYSNFAPIIFDYNSPTLTDLYDGIDHDNPKLDFAVNSEEFNDFAALSAAKKMAIVNSSSMVFSTEFIDYLSKGKSEKLISAYSLINELKRQIALELFVYTRREEAFSNLGLDPIFYVYKTKKEERHGTFHLSDGPFDIEEKDRILYEKFIIEVNLFLSSFVPGFYVHITDISSYTTEDGINMQRIALYRKEGLGDLPLSQESSGIKKIFDIAVALIYAYGNENCWLVVDELDSGVFENLLGQILQAINENGKGQIIFTAHNLAPLERLSYKSIVFTTSNPDNRYIRFSRTTGTNNLRSLYYRALALGGQKEELTSAVTVEDIDQALWEAYDSLCQLEENE